MPNKPGPVKAHARVTIQPPVLALIHIAFAFLLSWLIPLPLPVPPLLQTGGFLLAAIGLLLGMGALIAFRRARTAPAHHGLAPKLMTSGIYGFTRNPVYFGFVLMLIGLPLDAGTYWGILVVPIMIFLFNRLVIEPEEAYLVQKFGQEYKSYSSKVRRWI